jgi:hypothetical protein
LGFFIARRTFFRTFFVRSALPAGNLKLQICFLILHLFFGVEGERKAQASTLAF